MSEQTLVRAFQIHEFMYILPRSGNSYGYPKQPSLQFVRVRPGGWGVIDFVRTHFSSYKCTPKVSTTRGRGVTRTDFMNGSL